MTLMESQTRAWKFKMPKTELLDTVQENNVKFLNNKFQSICTKAETKDVY